MKKRILVIDDDALVIKSISKLLTHRGYAVETAQTGEQAELVLSDKPVQLIVCDIRMPGEDGISVIKKLKKKCAALGQDEVPFIFITGYASEEAPIDAVKLGAKDYILKPFDLDELLKSVETYIA